MECSDNYMKLTSNYQKNALTLAYLGDAVFSLMVRRYLVEHYNIKPNMLNKKANAVVCATTQAVFMEKIEPTLTQDELDIVMRARNSHVNNKAKNSSLQEYHKATEFEALIGYWYLNGEDEKLQKMFDSIVVEHL